MSRSRFAKTLVLARPLTPVPFSQLNHLVHEEALPQYTVIKVKKLVCNQMANQVLFSFPHKTLLILNNNQGKRVVIVLDLEVLQKGEMVGKKIGNPVTIGSDGKVGPPFNFNSYIVN